MSSNHISNIMIGQSSEDCVYIYIVRHGEAVNSFGDDKARSLTEKGCQQSKGVANWLVSNYLFDAKIDSAIVSPYVRAKQTFSEMLKVVTVGNTDYSNDITPDVSASDFHEYLNALLSVSRSSDSNISSLLLVSHMPFVSFLLDSLCDKNMNAIFATGSVAVVRYFPSTQRGELVEHYQGDKAAF